MLKISAVINTRNEELNIGYCLESLYWCDEIVIVDMESEDRTVEIAKRYTDNIFYHEKVLAFDIARKYAVEKATGDWILLVDADEMVPCSLAYTLKNIAIADSADIVSMPFKTYMMGEWIKHTGWWPEYHSRFFKRGSITFSGAVHAFIAESPTARKLQLPAEEVNAMVHFNYRGSDHFVEKLNRYTSIEALQMMQDGRRFSLFRMLAAGFRGFQVRYFTQMGFKDGYRGFFLSFMMGFYRALTYIKLWEAWVYRENPVDETYNRIRKNILESSE